MARPKTDAREQLLAAALDYVSKNGITDLSLRHLAAALGTSHRMLIFHFGSKEALLAEIVRAVEEQQPKALREIASDESATPVEHLRRLWRHVRDPALMPYGKLFVELYGQALHGRAHTATFLDGIIDEWTEPLADVFRRAGVPPETVQDDARLALSVMRGLAFDLLATGQTNEVNRAFERYLSFYEHRAEQDQRPRRTARPTRRPRVLDT